MKVGWNEDADCAWWVGPTAPPDWPRPPVLIRFIGGLGWALVSNIVSLICLFADATPSWVFLCLPGAAFIAGFFLDWKTFRLGKRMEEA